MGSVATATAKDEACRIASRLRNELFDRLDAELGMKRPRDTSNELEFWNDVESDIAIALAGLIERHLVREKLLQAKAQATRSESP